MRDSGSMHIIHTVSSLESEASGPSYTVPRLCQALAEGGARVELFSLGRNGGSGLNGYSDVRFAYDDAWMPLRKLGRSRAMRDALFSAQADVFHTHGLWMMPNVYPAQAARHLRKPLVLAPRGMLGPEALQFSRNKKQIFWNLVHAPLMKHVRCFHATAEQECEEIRAFGLDQPVAIVPNGIDVPPASDLPAPIESRSVLSLGRIHRKKGLEQLVRAWARVEPEYRDWRLDIVGPGEGGYDKVLLNLSRELGLRRLSISGPVYGADKIRRMAEAELFVLPTLNENFAMTVAESLACGTPVVSTKGAPWAGLHDNRCGWWVERGEDALATALRAALSLPAEERRNMGLRGRAWMLRDFGWTAIAEKMAATYTWLLSGGEPPQWIRLR
ncbi:MAG: glycosyltransferase [Rhizobiales bacterium]|nr:glycosyltransferase [Hyphomicrobiales bacterium]